MSDTVIGHQNEHACVGGEMTENAGKLDAGAAATGGIIGGLFAVSCCAVPLYLMSIGVTGALVSNLMALAPYRLYFAIATAVLFAIGFFLVYVRPRLAYAQGRACKPRYLTLSSVTIQLSLWLSAGMAGLAFAWPYVNRYLI